MSSRERSITRRITGVARIEARFFGPLVAGGLPPPVEVLGERIDAVVAQPHGLANLADRAPATVADDHGGEGGVVAPVLLVDVLEHLLSSLVLEIDVDVRRFVALAADEPLEQQLKPRGIDLGDAEAVTDRGVGGAAPPLTQDVAGSREPDNVVAGQKVRLVAKFLNEAQFVLQRPLRFLWNWPLVPLRCSFVRETTQVLRGCDALRRRLGGVLVAEFIETELGGAVGDLDGPVYRLGKPGERPPHLLGFLEVTFGVRLQPESGFLNRAAASDAGQHILKRAPIGCVVEGAIHCHHRQAGVSTKIMDPVEHAIIVLRVSTP